MSTKLKIQMGKCILIFDGIIIAFGAFVFGIRSALYAIIIIYIASTISDKIMLGISNRKMFYIMTSKPEEVRECIKNEFKRGITEIDVIGGYDEKKHLFGMCHNHVRRMQSRGISGREMITNGLTTLPAV